MSYIQYVSYIYTDIYITPYKKEGYPSSLCIKTKTYISILFPFVDEVAGYSGDFGSGVGWEDEEEKEAEDNGEEAEEEEEEEGETDDGGYIW